MAHLDVAPHSHVTNDERSFRVPGPLSPLVLRPLNPESPLSFLLVSLGLAFLKNPGQLSGPSQACPLARPGSSQQEAGLPVRAVSAPFVRSQEAECTVGILPYDIGT